MVKIQPGERSSLWLQHTENIMRRLAGENHESSKTSLGTRRRSLLGARIPLVSLIHALSVAEHGSFRQAAATLGVSQSTVSLRISKLEEDLGTKLFERRPRGVVPTQAGRIFLDQLNAVIDELDMIITTAGTSKSKERGHIRIGVHTPVNVGFLAELLEGFHVSHSDTDVELVEGRLREAVMHVRNDQVDVSLVFGVPSTEDCESRQLWREQLVVALPKTNPLVEKDSIVWQDLVNEKFLASANGPGPELCDHVLRRLSHWGYRPAIQLLDIQRDTLMHLVEAGKGITLATEAASLASNANIAFRIIADEPEPVIFSAVWSPYNRSQPLRDFLSLATKKSRERPA